MNNDANLGDRELTDEDNLTIDAVPVVSDDVYVEKTYVAEDDLEDDSGIGDKSTTGTRSMGGAAGTEHRHD
jgi:hypothetical protein